MFVHRFWRSERLPIRYSEIVFIRLKSADRIRIIYSHPSHIWEFELGTCRNITLRFAVGLRDTLAVPVESNSIEREDSADPVRTADLVPRRSKRKNATLESIREPSRRELSSIFEPVSSRFLSSESRRLRKRLATLFRPLRLEVRPFSRATEPTHDGYPSRLETSQLSRRVDRCEHSGFCERVSVRRLVAEDLGADDIEHLVRPSEFDGSRPRRGDTRRGSGEDGGSR